MLTTLDLPIIPNAPLEHAAAAESFGRLRLRRNRANGLI